MVSTDINGLFIANAIPLAVETPIRSPVNEPGPDAIQTPSKFVKEIAYLGGDINRFVTKYASKMLKNKY